jgi:hypothetical protein
MANKLQIKRTSVAGRKANTATIDTGELAINVTDGILYSTNGSVVFEVGANNTNVNVSNTITVNALSANGEIGTAGQVLSSNGTAVYWDTVEDVADNVLYVSESGSDTNDGSSIAKSFRTIKAAANAASSNTTIFIKSGNYTEITPIVLPQRVSLVGDNLRTVTIRPSNTTQDILHLNNACYVTGITFRDHTANAAAIAFPDAGAGAITTSPYVQDCSSITTTGMGMRVDGSKASGTKSMVSDAYTQFNQGGIGIHILNGGYAQLVSIFTICCTDGVLCSNGGFCSITNSNNSFGDRGLTSNGISLSIRTGTVFGANQIGDTIEIDGLAERPNVSEVIQFGTANTANNYYTIKSTTELSSNAVTLTLVESIGINDAPTDNDTVNFYQRSLITASSHTFEFVGTGTDILTATPNLGGIPIQENEIVEDNGGKVNFTSTDQWGDFRIGKDLIINNGEGTITGVTFDKSLFAVLTPYILALEG